MLPKKGLLLKERICSYRSKYFLYELTPNQKKVKRYMVELLPLKVYLVTLTSIMRIVQPSLVILSQYSGVIMIYLDNCFKNNIFIFIYI